MEKYYMNLSEKDFKHEIRFLDYEELLNLERAMNINYRNYDITLVLDRINLIGEELVRCLEEEHEVW